MKTYNDLLHSYRKEMEEKDIPSATLKAFLFELCNEKNINLYLNIDNEVDKGILAKFNSGMERILNQEPMNYVLGYSWFYGYRFNVNEDVLIPRYETEELAGLILEKVDLHYKNASSIVAADIGTGSGCIAITLNKLLEKIPIVHLESTINNDIKDKILEKNNIDLDIFKFFYKIFEKTEFFYFDEENLKKQSKKDDYNKLINRMKEMNIPRENLEWYTNLRRFGGCYHSGFGLGFERLIMYLTGIENIRDVIPYPRTPNNCDY